MMEGKKYYKHVDLVAEVNKKDILEEILNSKRLCTYQKSVTSQIIHTYLKTVRNTVLYGYAFDLPNDIGKLYIKKSAKNEGKRVFPARNNKRLNDSYSIRMESEFLVKSNMKFVAAASFKRKLKTILNNTEHEYRTNL